MSYIHVYSICYVPFLFKTACQKYFFQILSQKNAQIVNLRNLPIRVWILWIHDPFLDLPCKKMQYLFLDSEIWIWIIPQKMHPLRSWSERVFISQRSVYTNDTADWFRVCSNCIKLKKTTRKTHIVINCVKLKFKTNEKDVHCFREDFSVCLSLKD